MNSTNLENLCDIIHGKRINFNNIIDGPYKIFTGRQNPLDITLNEYNVENNEIIMSNCGPNTGYLNRFDEKIFVSDKCYIIKPKNINKDYLWYYLKFNQNNVSTNYVKGEIIDYLDKDKLLDEFMIPNLLSDHQEEIVKFLDEQFEIYNINSLKEDIPIFNFLIEKQYDLASELLRTTYNNMATQLLQTIYHNIPNNNTINL
jgi:hypothetical protein